MDQAKGIDGAYFSEEIRVKGPDTDTTYNYIWESDDDFSAPRIVFVGVALSLIPLVTTSALSRFQLASSTSIQRGFTISWLVLGIVYGIVSLAMLESSSETDLGYRTKM